MRKLPERRCDAIVCNSGHFSRIISHEATRRPDRHVGEGLGVPVPCATNGRAVPRDEEASARLDVDTTMDTRKRRPQ
jgi:hypothetical protein